MHPSGCILSCCDDGVYVTSLFKVNLYVQLLVQWGYRGIVVLNGYSPLLIHVSDIPIGLVLMDIADGSAQSADKLAEIFLIEEYLVFLKGERRVGTIARSDLLAFSDGEEEFASSVAFHIQVVDAFARFDGL